MSSILKAFMVVTFVLGLALTLSGCGTNAVNKKHVTFTVQDKERVTTGIGESMSSKYLLYTDKGTFEITDSIILGNFRSSDQYGRMRRGVRYTCETRGFRNGFLSMYPNLAECVEA